MNGSIGQEFKERASAERTHSRRQQSLESDARSYETSARLITARHIGGGNVILRNASIHAAASLNAAAHALRLLAKAEADAFNAAGA